MGRGTVTVSVVFLIAIVLSARACSQIQDHPEAGAGLPDKPGETTATKARPIQRKIIEFGFDMPSADFVAAHIGEMERRPFDGIVFRPGPADVRRRAFDLNSWSPEDLHLDTLQGILWTRFTDNFLHLYGASYSTMDWFNDEHWQTITANMELYRQAVQACRCVGVAFDPEYYGGTNPWAYTPSSYGNRTFEQVQKQVRDRGSQFIEALHEPGEDLTLLFFFLLGYVRDDVAREGSLRQSRYALLPAFIDGILDKAEPGITLVDGNEDAYYYDDTDQFFDAVTKIRAAAELISPENRPAYLTQVQVGSGLFVDEVLTEEPSEYERMLWNHNVYTGAATADRYVWIYSHDVDWWNGDLFRGAGSGIRNVRARLRALEPLGYDLAAASGQSSVVELPSVNLEIPKTTARHLIARVTGTEIIRVGFYRSGELVATDQRAPFRLDLRVVSTGPATFVARVFDSEGRHGTSAPIRVRISADE